MDVETREMLQAIISGMEGLEKRLDSKLVQQKNDILEVVQQQADTLLVMMDSQISSVKVIIENDVGKRIDSLFDGYKLAHEKQWELERKVEELEKRLERLEARAV